MKLISSSPADPAHLHGQRYVSLCGVSFVNRSKYFTDACYVDESLCPACREEMMRRVNVYQQFLYEIAGRLNFPLYSIDIYPYLDRLVLEYSGDLLELHFSDDELVELWEFGMFGKYNESLLIHCIVRKVREQLDRTGVRAWAAELEEGLF